ncbi:MAG: hypothetical protein ACOZF2_03505 [Thermodesulfobacteriota bacterium]
MSQEHSNTVKRKRSAKFYVQKIDDCRDCPGWPLGATAIVMTGTSKKIKDHDLVVYFDHQAAAHIGRIIFAEKKIILNTNIMAPDMFPTQPIVFPCKEIKRCDLVVMISYREEGVDQLLRNIRQRHALSKYVEGFEGIGV